MRKLLALLLLALATTAQAQWGMGPGPGAKAYSAGCSDPSFASVQLLAFNENGANGSGTFIDQSGAANTITALNDGGGPIGTVWSNSTAPTGLTTSVKTGDAASGNYGQVQAGDENDFDLRGIDFTLEIWFRLNAVTSGLEGIVYNNQFSIYVTNALSAPKIIFNFGLGMFPLLNDPSEFSLNTWNAVAVTRTGTTFRLYTNGTLVDTQTQTDFITASATTYLNSGIADYFYDGYTASARFTLGVARYTGASYTVPTLPLCAQ